MSSSLSLLHGRGIDTEMPQALQHPVAHQILADAADGERFQTHLGGGDGRGSGRPETASVNSSMK